MRTLHLFAGGGGGCLADRLLGHTTVGYVEWEPYCQKVLQTRIADGLLDSAPIFGDVREFVSSGYAREYRGVADVVAGGFPCQPFSVAGKRAGSADDRNMWPAFRDVVREVRPRYVFAENVSGLLTWDGGSYFGRILADLSALGFAVRWTVLGADDVGAPHRRKRLWLLGTCNHWGQEPLCRGVDRSERTQDGLPNPDGPQRRTHVEEREPEGRDTGAGRDGAARDVADADRAGQQQHGGAEPAQPQLAPAECCGWWDIDPAELADARRSGFTCGGAGEWHEADREIRHSGIANGGENVADAEIRGGQNEPGHKSGKPQWERRTGSGNGSGADVADSDRDERSADGRESDTGADGRDNAAGSGYNCREIGGSVSVCPIHDAGTGVSGEGVECGPTQPNLGRVADGLPFGVHGADSDESGGLE